MNAPTIVCRDQELSLELRAVGFTAELSPGTGLIGAAAMKKVGAQRFLNQYEVAQRRAAQSRFHVTTASLFPTDLATCHRAANTLNSRCARPVWHHVASVAS